MAYGMALLYKRLQLWHRTLPINGAGSSVTTMACFNSLLMSSIHSKQRSCWLASQADMIKYAWGGLALDWSSILLAANLVIMACLHQSHPARYNHKSLVVHNRGKRLLEASLSQTPVAISALLVADPPWEAVQTRDQEAPAWVHRRRRTKIWSWAEPIGSLHVMTWAPCLYGPPTVRNPHHSNRPGCPEHNVGIRVCSSDGNPRL